MSDWRKRARYTDYQLFRKNDGFSVFRDTIHDGLTAGWGKGILAGDAEDVVESLRMSLLTN